MKLKNKIVKMRNIRDKIGSTDKNKENARKIKAAGKENVRKI